MSHRAGETRPSDEPVNVSNGGESHRPPSTTGPGRYGQPPILAPAGTLSPRSRPQPPPGSTRSVELPPLLQGRPATIGGFSPAPRSAAFSSILNPAENDEPPKDLRRRVSQLDSPRTSIPTLPSLATTTSPFVASPPFYAASLGDRQPRRILTPRSPALHRAASLGQLNAQPSPYPVSPRTRFYSTEPGIAGIPPLPTPPAANRSSYGFPVHPSGGQSTNLGSGRVAKPASASTSPRSSFSSYSQPGQASPGPQYASASVHHLSTAYSGPESSAGAPLSQRPVGVPISSSGGQNVYQMMTLETTSGTVQVPVDVQAASRVADEKRRRNAGASARFRQRRKEKEKEASTTISRLEQQVKELGEDMDFYKRERDYMAGVIRQVPGGDRHFPRPLSPRQQRTGVSGPTASSGYMSVSDQMPRNPDEGRNVRRRTSTLSLPPPPPPPPAMPPNPFPSAYLPQHHPQPLVQPPQHHPQQQPLPPHPAMHASQSALPPPPPMDRAVLPRPDPPQLLQATPRTGPWNPYAHDRRPPGGPGQGRDNQ